MLISNENVSNLIVFLKKERKKEKDKNDLKSPLQWHYTIFIIYILEAFTEWAVNPSLLLAQMIEFIV